MHPTRDDSTLLSANQITAMLAARRALVLGTAATLAAVTLVILMLVPRTWTASTDVYVDFRDSDPIAGRGFSAMLDDSYVQTQIDMLRSQIVAAEVAERLGLRQTEAYREDVAAHGEARANERLIDAIARNVDVTSARDSRVLRVTYTGESAESAREFANAIVASYLDITQRLATNAARSRTEQYNAQLEQLRQNVDSVQAELTAYQQEHGILQMDDADNLDTRELNELTTQLALLRNRRAAAEAENDVAGQLLAQGVDASELPSIGQLPGINDLKSKLSAVNLRLNEASATLGPNHPTVRGLGAERNGLAERIRREAQAAYTSQRDDVARLRAQETALERAIEDKRRYVLEQKGHQDRLASYQRQLAGAQQVYNAALQRYDTLLMASSVSLPNVTVLRPAELPSEPSGPRVLASLAASIIVGLIAGLALALVLELRGRRVRCLDDMLRDLPLPLIGHIGRSPRTARTAP